MSFKDTWRPRVDGVDYIDVSAVNEIAEEVIKQESDNEERDRKIVALEKGYDYVGSVSSEEYKEGYIAFDLTGGDVVDIRCSALEGGETNMITVMRVVCGNSSRHNHKLYVDIGNRIPTHYVKIFDVPTGYSTWYIPIIFEPYMLEDINFYAKGVVNKLKTNLNVRFVDTLPSNAVAISPTEYATKEDIGDISSALMELHNYAQTLINGGDA